MNTIVTTNSNRSRHLALVNRSNSDDELNDMAIMNRIESAISNGKKKTIRRMIKQGTKKNNTTSKQQQPQEQPGATEEQEVHSSFALDGLVNVVDSFSNSTCEKQTKLGLITKKNHHHHHHQPLRSSIASLPTVSSDVSSDSDNDDSSSHHKNDIYFSCSNINNNNNKNSNSSNIIWEHGWLKDNHLIKTSVYYRNMNQPITLLQAVVRGRIARKQYRQIRIQQLQAEILFIQNISACRIQNRIRYIQEKQKHSLHVAAQCIQTRVRIIQQKQVHAIIPLQTICRGWYTRLQYKILVLETQLAAIHTHHQHDLRGIQHAKKLEIRRIDCEYKVIANKDNKRQSKVLEATIHDIDALRNENRNLRQENETIQKASFIMMKKNERTKELTTLHESNLQELQVHVPQFERDYQQLLIVNNDYLERIQRYQEALSMRNEHIRFEHKVTKCLIQTINVMLQHINTKCQNDLTLKNDILNQARESLKGTKNNNNNKNKE